MHTTRRFLNTTLLILFASASITSALAAGWQTVPLGGGGFVTGLLAHPTVNGPIYCRTDVGGAFRWDAANVQWKSISDAMVSGTAFGAANLMGTESIAVDPSDGTMNKVYVAAGASASPSTGPCGIYATNDSSVASPVWTAISGSTIAVASNPSDSSGKVYGERLGVDPNNPNILYYGSNKGGLYKGVNSGTWSWSTVADVPVGDAVVGVSFVAFDKNGGTTTVNGQLVSKYIYAGVYNTNVTGSSGVYRSTDGGVTWNQMLLSSTTPTLTRPFRGEVDGDGNLYVTHNVGTTGYVAKLTRDGATINPSITGTTLGARTICGLAVDPTRNAAGYFPLMVSEYSTGINIWRSVNSGSTWVLMNISRHGTEPDGTPSLTGGWQRLADLMITPGNPSEVWTCDFSGVARTQNIKDDTTVSDWYRLQKGQEELCVQTLKNAPLGSARLMVGVADANGFQYSDVAVRPDFSNQDPGHDVFTNPTYGNTTSLDFCEGYQNVWARTWVDSTGTGYGSGGVSLDNGRTWMSFGEIDCKTVINSGTADWENWDIGTYLSTQRAKGVKVVTLVLHSSNTPERSGNILQFDSLESGTANAPRLLINGTTTINPTADSYVAYSGSATNFGSSTVLQVSYAYSEGSNSRWIYLKFDLNSIPTITTGTLQLHRISSTNTTKFPVHVYGCSNTTWVESTITWNNRPSTLAGADPIYAPNCGVMGGRVAISATNPNLLVWVPMGVTNYPRFSNDRGVTWVTGTGVPVSQIQDRFYPSTLIQPLAADRVNGKFYYMKLGGVSGGNHAIYSSTNNGANWVLSGTVPAASYNVYRAQLVAAPAADDLWVCDDGVSGTTAGGLWRSTDGGVTWTKQLPGTITAVREVSFGKAQSGSGYTVFINGYKGGVKGVWRSDDYGSNWVNLGLPPTIAAVDALAGDRQSYGGVFIGTNGRGTYYYNPGPTSITLGDIADSYVQKTTPSTNYGTSTTLMSKNDSAIMRYTYLKFDMSSFSGSIVSGTLWLNMSGHGTIDMPVAVYACSDISWIESGTGSITWNNKPATTGSPLATTTVYVADPIGSWYAWDVTSYLQQQKNAGINTVTLVMVNTIENAGNSAISFNSDEAGGTVVPQLVVNYQFP